MRTQSSTNDRARTQASFAKSLLPPSVSAHNEVITEKQKKKREADLRKTLENY